MKLMSITYGGLIFIFVIITGSGWYGGLVLDYESIGATEKINTTDLGHEDILANLTETQSDMEGGLRSNLDNIPILGGITIQVFSSIQMLTSFFASIWDALSIGASLITGINEIIPYPINSTVLNLIQITLIFLFVGAIVAAWLGRKVD